MSWSLRRRIFIDKSAESVENEVLDHHLENEDLGTVCLERIPVFTFVRGEVRKGENVWRMEGLKVERVTNKMYNPPLVLATLVPKHTAP